MTAFTTVSVTALVKSPVRMLGLLFVLILWASPQAMAQMDANTGAMIQDGPSMVEPLRQFSSAENERRYFRLVWELRCPQCDNQAIGDSNAPVSADMRQRVAQMIEAGSTDREIVDFMIARWGDGVTFRPRLGLHTVWIWVVGAFLVTFLIAVVLGIRMKYAGNALGNGALSPEEQDRLKALRNANPKEET